MKRMLFCFLLLVALGFLISCAGGRIGPRQTLGKGQSLEVDIAEIVLREEMQVAGGLYSSKYIVTIPPAMAEDQTAHQILPAFRKKFISALGERGIQIVPGAPIKIFVGVAHGTKPVGVFSQLRCLAADIRVVEKNKPLRRFGAVVDSFAAYHLPVTDYEGLAEKLAEASANDIVIQLKKTGGE